MRQINLSHAELLTRLHYDPESGIFTWLRIPETASHDVTWNKRFAGKQAGGLMVNGYRSISICKEHFYAHRLAWFYMTGKWPNVIDHINGKKDANEWINLRDGTYMSNSQNRCVAYGKSEHVGVWFEPRNRKPWVVQITANYKKFYVGCFATEMEAVAAYKEAKAIYHTAAA